MTLFVGYGSVCHHHMARHQHHIERIEHAQHMRRVRYDHKWQPIWTARKKPTSAHLSRLTINHPYGNALMVVNHNHSTLNRRSWHYDHVDFSHKDRLGRVSYPATAYLARGNATGDALRTPQKVKPVGWRQHEYQGDWVLNRGHLIAYSLTKNIKFNGRYSPNRVTGNQNDPSNLFTETAFCNQQLQYTFETRIRMQLERNKRIIYQVQPIFRGHELMARGVHLQAISTDGKFQFNVYLFNIQPGVKFNYETGNATPSSSAQYKLPTDLIQSSQRMDNRDKDMQWQRKIMRLYHKHLITKWQACYDEEHILGNYVISY